LSAYIVKQAQNKKHTHPESVSRVGESHSVQPSPQVRGLKSNGNPSGRENGFNATNRNTRVCKKHLTQLAATGGAPPPPPPPGGGAPPPSGMPLPGAAIPGLRPKKKMEPSKRMKQLHWIKVSERKVASTIWETMRDEDMDIEKDTIEDLFAAKVAAKVTAVCVRRIYECT